MTIDEVIADVNALGGVAALRGHKSYNTLIDTLVLDHKDELHSWFQQYIAAMNTNHLDNKLMLQDLHNIYEHHQKLADSAGYAATQAFLKQNKKDRTDVNHKKKWSLRDDIDDRISALEREVLDRLDAKQQQWYADAANAPKHT